MAVTSVNTDTFIRDATIFLRDELNDNLTDPISGSRSGNEQFVMTSYPTRDTKYPVITVQITNISYGTGALQSEIYDADITVEVRVWARKVAERDSLTQDVINQLRSTNLDADGSVQAGLHDFQLLSGVNIDEDGQDTPKSRVMEFGYRVVVGS